ncbi:MAG: glycosyltransferase [Holophagaceae bacterium]|nr:glycosyltransferase [Holophagaceae bacterium]
MPRKPLVTIAIPNYNYAKYVGQAIESAVNQTYENLEVVVSDNASTDGSWDIIKAFEDHPKVELFRQKETLPVGNHFGFVLAMANARYLVFLSSDDMLKPTFIEKTMKVILDHPDRSIGMVVTEREVVDAGGAVRDFPPFYTTSCVVPGEKQAKVFLMGNPFVPSQSLLDRKVLQPGLRSFRRQSPGQDWKRRTQYACLADCAMWFNMCLASDFGYVREKLAVYREHFQGEAAAHMGNLQGIFELYTMKRNLIEDARRKGLDTIVAFGEEAIRKIGSDCLKWASMFLEHRDLVAARRLQHMAAAIDPSLASAKTYLALDYVLGANLERPFEAFRALAPFCGATLRDFSYDPPEGYLAIES